MSTLQEITYERFLFQEELNSLIVNIQEKKNNYELFLSAAYYEWLNKIFRDIDHNLEQIDYDNLKVLWEVAEDFFDSQISNLRIKQNVSIYGKMLQESGFFLNHNSVSKIIKKKNDKDIVTIQDVAFNSNLNKNVLGTSIDDLISFSFQVFENIENISDELIGSIISSLKENGASSKELVSSLERMKVRIINGQNRERKL